MSTDTLTRQMHESRARRLVDAETRAAAAEAIRKPGLDSIIREGADFLGDGGPWLPIGQEDAGGLIRAVAAYDLVERALRALEYEVERPESPWRREVNHRNVAEWATARIRHADEALRRSQVRVRELEDELANWRSSGWLRAGL